MTCQKLFHSVRTKRGVEGTRFSTRRSSNRAFDVSISCAADASRSRSLAPSRSGYRYDVPWIATCRFITCQTVEVLARFGFTASNRSCAAIMMENAKCALSVKNRGRREFLTCDMAKRRAKRSGGVAAALLRTIFCCDDAAERLSEPALDDRGAMCDQKPTRSLLVRLPSSSVHRAHDGVRSPRHRRLKKNKFFLIFLLPGVCERGSLKEFCEMHGEEPASESCAHAKFAHCDFCARNIRTAKIALRV